VKPWPSPESLPRDTDSPLAWARFYASLGMIILPTPCAADLEAAVEVNLRAEIEALAAAGEPASAEKKAEIRKAIEAEVSRFVKAPGTKTLIGWRGRDRAPTEDEIDQWWGASAGAAGPLRGIWARTGLGAGGAAPLAVVDVDTKHGGDVAPWRHDSDMVALTPSGGVHAWYLDDGSVPSRGARPGEAWPGVDLRGTGGGVVLPSGRSSPGRRWLSWSEPATLSEQARAVIDARARGGGGISGATLDRSARLAGTVGAALQEVATDGTKHATAGQIVGILARPFGLPADVVDPALAVLADDGADEADLERWRHLFTHGPRTVEHAIEFLGAWNRQRCSPSWTDRKVRSAAIGFWGTANRREGGNAGAFDMARLEFSSGMEEPTIVDEQAAEASAASEPASAPSMPATAPAITAPQRPAIILPEPVKLPAEFAMPLSVARTWDSISAELALSPISVETLPPWLDWRGVPDLTSGPYGYGLGPWFNTSIGRGLRRGSFIAIGALLAKGGKTSLLGQWVEGLIHQGAQRLLGVHEAAKPWAKDERFTDDGGPIYLAVWLTEMEKHIDLDNRLIGRYLGVDWSFIGLGVDGYLAPGIQDLAYKIGGDADPRAVAMMTSKVIQNHITNMGPLAMARALTINIDPSKIPRKKSGRHAEDPRLGQRLLETVCEVVDATVDSLAVEHAIDRSRFLPILVVDPIHRFVDASGEDRITAINVTCSAMRSIAQERKWIVFFTNDTTKGTAAGDKGLEGDPAALAAAAMAGSQELSHQPEMVVVVHADQNNASGTRTRIVPVQVRVCLSRRAPPGDPLPFLLTSHLGRYVAVDPARAADPCETMSPGLNKRRGRPPKKFPGG